MIALGIWGVWVKGSGIWGSYLKEHCKQRQCAGNWAAGGRGWRAGLSWAAEGGGHGAGWSEERGLDGIRAERMGRSEVRHRASPSEKSFPGVCGWAEVLSWGLRPASCSAGLCDSGGAHPGTGTARPAIGSGPHPSHCSGSLLSPFHHPLAEHRLLSVQTHEPEPL